MPRTPAEARYNFLPIVLTLGLSVGGLALAGYLFGGGNEHGISHAAPGQEFMPNYPVVIPSETKPSSSVVLPPKVQGAAAVVCRGFVFIDRDHHDVIVNPVIDQGAERPLHVFSVDGSGVQFGEPQSRANFELWRYSNGRLTRDGEDQLNGCTPETITTVNVRNKDNDSYWVIADKNTNVQNDQKLNPDPITAIEHGVIHREFTLNDQQIEGLIDDLYVPAS